jgi:TubC N-terminal docking domain
MNALQTIIAANERGVLVTVTDSEDLYVTPKEKLTPELRAALRENKAEIVNGKHPPLERYEIVEMIPAVGWYAEMKRTRTPQRHELYPLVAWARVIDHEAEGAEWVHGMVPDIECDWSAELVCAAIAERLVQYHYLPTPQDVAQAEEDIRDFHNWQPNTMADVDAMLGR